MRRPRPVSVANLIWSEMTPEQKAKRLREFERQTSGVTSTGRRVRRKNGVSTPEARAAYNKYWAAVRRGEIRRPDRCDLCSRPGPVQAEHRSYVGPNAWRPWAHVCQSCHNKLPPAGGTIR